MAALSRMAQGMHKKISIGPKDTVIFSSHPIPGNEKAVSKIINELYAKGADVIFQDTHVSGHACREEIKLIYNLVRPKYSIPVHGEYRHLKAQASLAKELGYSSENILIMSSGEILELSDEFAGVIGKVPAGAVYVDGLGVGDVGNVVLRDRQRLSEDGIFIVVMSIESSSNMVVSGPDIVSRGFVYVKESDELIDEARGIVIELMDKFYERQISDWNKIRSAIRDELGDLFWKKTKRRPIILPILMEV